MWSQQWGDDGNGFNNNNTVQGYQQTIMHKTEDWCDITHYIDILYPNCCDTFVSNIDGVHINLILIVR